MNIVHFSSRDSFWDEAVDFIKQLLKAKNEVCVGASGGSSSLIFSKLIEAGVDISKMKIYLIDERYVSRDHEHSNYKLLSKQLAVSPEPLMAVLHSFDTSLPISQALAHYEKILPDYFDLTIFGMGPDGHTASLFPYQSSLDSENLVEHTTTDIFDVHDRLTLTFKALERSKSNLVLAAGQSKKPVIEALNDPAVDYHQYPIARIMKQGKSVMFYAD